jgi:Zn-dependent M28 family amino/carboxypeptidase
MLCLLAVGAQAQTRSKLVDNFVEHATYLASDDLMGRGTGSEYIHLTTDYIADQFQSMELRPYSGDSYLQSFSIPGVSDNESNMIGFIPARRATSSSLVFTAHYDAYGIVDGEVYNGARDNAIGVAALIELARLFTQEVAPEQNLVFIATAAEEGGQYGSRHYSQNPLFPLEEVTIAINIDGFNVSGPREDYFVIPREGIDYLDEIDAIATSLGWVYDSPDWIGSLNTSFDTTTFLFNGTPAFTLWVGDRGKGGEEVQSPDFGPIHSADDEITDQWDWSGVEDHLMLYKAIADYFIEHPTGISVTDTDLFFRAFE